MKRIIILIGIIAWGPDLFSQNNTDNFISGVEKNNTTLSAFRKNADAERIGNKTGIYLQNPEVAFNYLWGNSSLIGNRTDLSIRQTFDFPTAYVYKSQISEFKNGQVELDYEKERKSILLQARLICMDLIYTNALKSEFSRIRENAQNIANSFKSKFETGDANILEYNKAQLNLVYINRDADLNEVQHTTLLAELKNLNAGIFIDFNDSIFPVQTIVADFEQWYKVAEQTNPLLTWIKQEVIISQKQEKLNAALSLPKFQGGYMSEKVPGQQFQGVTIGLTIPMWENKNAVQYAKAKTLAVQSVEADTRLRFYNKLKSLHTKATTLQKMLAGYRENQQLFNSSELLYKALVMGEISLAEYFFELSLVYESTKKLLELELDLNQTVADLYQYQ